MTTAAAGWAAALLDVDGVLVDTERGVLELWAKVCERAGRAAPGAESYDQIIGRSPDHTVGHLFPGANASVRDAALRLVRELEQSLSMMAIEGAGDLIRVLRSRSVPVALVTGASRTRLAAVLRLLGTDVDAAVTWGEARGKPDPEPFMLASRRLGVDAAECLAIEDAPAGVRSAVAAGATCVGIAPVGSARDSDLREAGATLVVESLRALDVVASSTREGIRFAVQLRDGRSGRPSAPTVPTLPDPTRGMP